MAEPVIERIRKSFVMNNVKKKINSLADNEIEYGEEQVMKISKVKCDVSQYLKVPQLEGDLIMTNYKLIFKYSLPMERTTDGKL